MGQGVAVEVVDINATGSLVGKKRPGGQDGWERRSEAWLMEEAGDARSILRMDRG
jgi:hypothetical protein